MKIISWNVNGIRACARKGFVSFLEKEDPDILCIQESKAHPVQIFTRDMDPNYTLYQNVMRMISEMLQKAGFSKREIKKLMQANFVYISRKSKIESLAKGDRFFITSEKYERGLFGRAGLMPENSTPARIIKKIKKDDKYYFLVEVIDPSGKLKTAEISEDFFKYLHDLDWFLETLVK
ncbi:MAG: hypothetical protein OXM55_02380 [Bdellovibrionales bacterium]|nr:hypothetical protein [Bdellovibrionales bacterium]